MDIDTFLIESSKEFPDLANDYIGEVLLHASEIDNNEILTNGYKFINLVSQRHFEKIILNLCKTSNYNMVSLLLQNACREKINMIGDKNFVKIILNLCDEETNDILLLLLQNVDESKFDSLNNEFLNHIIEVLDIEYVKQFIKMFPNIFINRGNGLVNGFYKHNNPDLIKFMTTIYVDEKIIEQFLYGITQKSYENSNLVILKYLFIEFHKEIKNIISKVIEISSIRDINVEIIKLILKTFPDIDIIHKYFYYNLVNKNKRDILQYMFDNYNHNYIKDIFRHIFFNVVEEKTIDILLDDIIRKNLQPHIDNVNYLFRLCCREGFYDCAYKLKCNWPEIETNVSCNKGHTKLDNWLQNGCPINCSLTTKSARKVV